MDVIKHYSRDNGMEVIGVMEVNGLAYARAYAFLDDKKTFYLDSLSVCEKVKRLGYGTKLQEMREKIAKEKGYKYTMLWVKKGTWMRKWYGRRGYTYYKPYKEEKAVWLRKII